MRFEDDLAMDTVVTFQGNTLLFSGPKAEIDRLCALAGHLGCERSVPRSWFGQMMDFHVLDLGEDDAVALYELSRYEVGRLKARVPQDPPENALLSDFRQGFLYLEGSEADVATAVETLQAVGLSDRTSKPVCRRAWRAEFPKRPAIFTFWVSAPGWMAAESLRTRLNEAVARTNACPDGRRRRSCLPE